MFRASSRPSSRDQQLQYQPLVFLRSVVIAVLLLVVGPAGWPDHDQQHCYHHAPKVKPEAATAVVELLMMGVRTPETCWTVNKRQVINWRNCCIQLVDLFELLVCNLHQMLVVWLNEEEWDGDHIKAQRLSWFGHVQRMPDTRTVKKIFNWKPLTKRSQGRPKYRLEDNIQQDICQTKIKNWIACVQDREKWKEVVEKTKTFN